MAREFKSDDWRRPQQLMLAEGLHRLVSGMPDQMRSSDEECLSGIVYSLLSLFLGPKWVEIHVAEKVPPSRKPGFFQLESHDVVIRETKAHRIFDLVEMLFNLQQVPGFLDFLIKFRALAADGFEGAYGELQIAKMLFATGHDFRFVRASSVKREDYDFEIIMPDRKIACVEAKSREEETAINPSAVASKLGKARRQLPQDAPGIILFKVPQHWFSDHSMGAQLREVASDFMRNSTTVVSVKFYVSVVDLDLAKEMTMHQHAYDEVTSPKAIANGDNWNIFLGNGHKPDWKWLKDFLPE